MSAVTLYEIADARAILAEWLEESEGELTPELETLLAEIDEQAETKVERVGLFIRECQVHADAVKVERDRLTALAKRNERAVESLKNYLKVQLERLGKPKVQGKLCTVALQANPPAVKGDLPESELIRIHRLSYAAPGCIVRYIPESYALDRRAALDLYKAGQPLPDGLTVEQGTSLRIR